MVKVRIVGDCKMTWVGEFPISFEDAVMIVHIVVRHTGGQIDDDDWYDWGEIDFPNSYTNIRVKGGNKLYEWEVVDSDGEYQKWLSSGEYKKHWPPDQVEDLDQYNLRSITYSVEDFGGEHININCDYSDKFEHLAEMYRDYASGMYGDDLSMLTI